MQKLIRPRFEVLDSFRGVCATMVVILHCYALYPPEQQPHIIRSFYLFVDFFFVLSGFVIAHSYRDRLGEGFGVKRFMLLRLGRVYPLHVVVLTVYLITEVVVALVHPAVMNRGAFTGEYQPMALIHAVFLIQIFAGPEGTLWNSPAWSIAAEFWTYFFFALIFSFSKRYIFLITSLLLLLMPIAVAISSPDYMSTNHSGALFRCLFGFSAGIILHYFYRSAQNNLLKALSSRLATSIEIFTLIVVFFFLEYFGSGIPSLLSPILFSIVIIVYANEQGLVSWILKTTPFLTLGALSYSIYMVHFYIVYRISNLFQILNKITGGALQIERNGAGYIEMPFWWLRLSFVGVVLIIVYAVSALTYRYVELPGQRVAREWVLGRRDKRAALAEAQTPSL